MTSYQYDDANRLTEVNGVAYIWDNNGNLLNDGVNTYTYDTANRLKTLTGPSLAASYGYNGLGDRLQETLNGQPTTFTMDLNIGLTQALSDGTNTYLYGNGRLAQINTDTEYFLGDALGSVRQLTNTSGAVTYASAYDPYGVTTQISGASQSAYGYTNEYASQGLIYLRSRMYDPASGRFTTRDSWQGDYNRPLSLNHWMYVEGNPINYTDPSGHSRLNCIGCGPSATRWFTVELRNWKDIAKEHVEIYDMALCEAIKHPNPNNPPSGIALAKLSVATAVMQSDGAKFPYKVIDFNYADAPNRLGNSPSPFIYDMRGNQLHGKVYEDALTRSGILLQGGREVSPSELTWRVPGGGSVTLCGTCIERSELGNFMFGYYAYHLGLPDLEARNAAKALGGLTRTWDENAYQFGYAYGAFSVKNPVTLISLCAFLKQKGIPQMVDPFVQGYIPTSTALHSGFGHYTSTGIWDSSWGPRREVGNKNASPITVGGGLPDVQESFIRPDLKTRNLECRYDPPNCE